MSLNIKESVWMFSLQSQSPAPPAGSAMDALHSIQNFLKGRPKSFKSMDHAIEWR